MKGNVMSRADDLAEMGRIVRKIEAKDAEIVRLTAKNEAFYIKILSLELDALEDENLRNWRKENESVF